MNAPGIDRRRCLGLIAGAALLRPAQAQAGRPFDREIVGFAPEPGEVSVHARLNALIARLSAAGGGTVRLAPGLYPTAAPIRVPGRIRLAGAGQEGAGASILRLAAEAPDPDEKAGILWLRGDGPGGAETRAAEIVIEDLVIDGNRAARPRATGPGGISAAVHGLLLRRVTMRDCAGYGLHARGGGEGLPGRVAVIEDCRALGNGRDGFTLDHLHRAAMRDCLAEGNDRAGLNIVGAARDIGVSGTVLRGNGGNGLVVQNGAGRVTVAESLAEGNGLHGVYLRDGFEVRLADNRIGGNRLAGIRVRGGRDVAIEGNAIGPNLASAATRQAEIQIDGYRGEGARGVRVLSNSIRAARNAALIEKRGASRTRVHDNVLFSPGEGIRLSDAASAASGNVRLRF